MDENEGEEIVVTAQRLQESSGGGVGGGGGWGWASFYSTSGGGADSFDFGGGGGGDIVVTAPEQPAEEPPPEEEGEEIIVTAPEPPTNKAFEAGAILTNWAFDNVVGDFRVTLDGDTATLEFFDVLTGEHVEYVHSPEGQFWTEKPFDVDSYQHDPAFFRAPAYETEHLDWL